MSEFIGDGGPAFPRSNTLRQKTETGWIDWELPGRDGMSLRDWFAGQAIAGLWAQAAGANPDREGVPVEEWPQRMAVAAYKQADAMLEVMRRASDASR